MLDSRIRVSESPAGEKQAGGGSSSEETLISLERIPAIDQALELAKMLPEANDRRLDLLEAAAFVWGMTFCVPVLSLENKNPEPKKEQ